MRIGAPKTYSSLSLSEPDPESVGSGTEAVTLDKIFSAKKMMGLRYPGSGTRSISLFEPGSENAGLVTGAASLDRVVSATEIIGLGHSDFETHSWCSLSGPS